MSINGVDVPTVIIITLFALFAGGGIYAALAKTKLKDAAVLCSRLSDLFSTFLEAVEDGSITAEERAEIMASVGSVVAAVRELVSREG